MILRRFYYSLKTIFQSQRGLLIHRLLANLHGDIIGHFETIRSGFLKLNSPPNLLQGSFNHHMHVLAGSSYSNNTFSLPSSPPPTPFSVSPTPPTPLQEPFTSPTPLTTAANAIPPWRASRKAL